MAPKTFESASVFTRILDRYGLPVAFLGIVLCGMYIMYTDMKAQNERLLSAFIQQSEASQRMAASVETLARAVEANTAEMRARFADRSRP